MEASHRGAAESGAAFLGGMNSADFLQISVELLQIMGGEFCQLDVPNVGDRVDVHHQLVAILRGQSNIRLGVERVPGLEPICHRVLVGAADVQSGDCIHRLFQLSFYLRLCLTQYIFDDPFAGF